MESPESQVVVCNNVVLSSSNQFIVCAYAIVHINIVVNKNIIRFIVFPFLFQPSPGTSCHPLQRGNFLFSPWGEYVRRTGGRFYPRIYVIWNFNPHALQALSPTLGENLRRFPERRVLAKKQKPRLKSKAVGGYKQFDMKLRVYSIYSRPSNQKNSWRHFTSAFDAYRTGL